MREVLVSAYEFLFSAEGFNVTRDSRDQLENQFKQAGVSGDTVRKCIAFFLAAAKDAGIEVSPWFGTPRTGRPARRPRTPKGVPAPDDSMDTDDSISTITPVEFLYQLLDPSSMNDEEQSAVWVLIKYLKKQEAPEE